LDDIDALYAAINDYSVFIGGDRQRIESAAGSFDSIRNYVAENIGLQRDSGEDKPKETDAQEVDDDDTD
jgi:hypothetical protein